MALGNVFEINTGMVGNILSTGGEPLGVLSVQPGSPPLDQWQWDDEAFPGDGFAVECIGSRGPCDPTVTYVAYIFAKDVAEPFEHWPGANKVFRMERNGSLVGWVEMQLGDKPDMMWWSNGDDLNDSREIVMEPGDVLTFSNDAFPTDPLYPLASVQTPV
jgi:hypothetical protein